MHLKKPYKFFKFLINMHPYIYFYFKLKIKLEYSSPSIFD